MEKTTAHHLYKTELKDRTLWYDGDSSYKAEHLLSLIQKYKVKYVDEINSDVEQCNKQLSKAQEFKVKDSIKPFDFEWTLPEKYKTLDVREYLFDQLAESAKNVDEEEFSGRAIRVIDELSLYEKYGFFDVLRAIIYVINTLTESNSVWGVGRGSSVSSYVLYLIGVHDVDSYAYDLDIEDFLHD